jgi:hemoglobin-like flavoprotein
VTVTTVSTTTTSASGASGAHELIRSTWEVARKNGSIAPKVLFRFIKAHPEYQKMFPAFADVPQSQLLKNGNFLAQAYTIAAGLNVVIQSLGSQELLAQELNHLGVTHFSRGAKPHMFEEFGKVFVSVLEDELGSRFTAEAKEAFAGGFRGLTAAIVKSLK